METFCCGAEGGRSERRGVHPTSAVTPNRAAASTACGAAARPSSGRLARGHCRRSPTRKTPAAEGTFHPLRHVDGRSTSSTVREHVRLQRVQDEDQHVPLLRPLQGGRDGIRARAWHVPPRGGSGPTTARASRPPEPPQRGNHAWLPLPSRFPPIAELDENGITIRILAVRPGSESAGPWTGSATSRPEESPPQPHEGLGAAQEGDPPSRAGEPLPHDGVTQGPSYAGA